MAQKFPVSTRGKQSKYILSASGKSDSLIYEAYTRPQSMQSSIANLNDALINLVHQKTQSNRLGKQVKPAAAFQKSSYQCISLVWLEPNE